MKVVSYITPDMNQMNEELKHSCIEYEKKLSERGIYIREKRILTATIVLYILESSSDGELCSGWIYYPKTGIEDFISSIRSESNLKRDEFAETCTTRVLKEHNWHNHDIECAIRNRNIPASAA